MMVVVQEAQPQEGNETLGGFHTHSVNCTTTQQLPSQLQNSLIEGAPEPQCGPQ